MAANITFAEYTNTGDSVPNWAAGQVRYHIYNEAVSCADETAAFLAMSLDQQIASTTTVSPVATSFHAQARICSTVQASAGSSTSAVVDNSQFIPDPTV